MMGYTTGIKLCISTTLAGLTAFWGWFGWLTLLWIGCMLLDWLTGTMAACKQGNWHSDIARRGIWSKLGSLIVVVVAVLLDFGVSLMTEHLQVLPFTYTVVLSPIVIAWYILTELGSILENAGEMGASLPKFLTRWIAVLKKKVDESGKQ